ncbi:alpha/beta fold hydrolase [Modestobacter altitudinis]|uniref:alpha/beta fold hydrolase n=1 Tax=Modestobacter altitudinis TaxID=2213158 RepID=UPI00110CE7EC|nr:alpha/beta fold hydrolase [Modestobacter altitudinis]
MEPDGSEPAGAAWEPVRWTGHEVRTEVVLLHGHRVSCRIGGSAGPVLLLLHGLLGSGASFGPALDELARTHRVVAPDLLGHGASEKPTGDYSLGALATLARDLLVVLGVESATVVGHSLGGGVAMQLAYQFPASVERLVLVDSGGLGRNVSPALRAVALPGAEWVLPAVFNPYAARAAARLLRPLHRVTPPALAQVVAGLATLADAEARAAFVLTARSVIGVGGQRVSATDRLYLTAALPLLLVWGGRDPVIPVAHGETLHAQLPGSTLVVFDRAGHFPQVEDPGRFAGVVGEFVRTTTAAPPAARDAAWAAALRAGSAQLPLGAADSTTS